MEVMKPLNSTHRHYSHSLGSCDKITCIKLFQNEPHFFIWFRRHYSSGFEHDLLIVQGYRMVLPRELIQQAC